MHRGYMALWRKFEDHPFWKEKRVFSKSEAWIDLLWQAQHDKEPKQVILGMKTLICNYGESLKSMETWGRRWSWGKSRVKRFLDLLVDLHQIRYANETITTRISILNYEQYDPKRNGKGTQKKRKRNGSGTEAGTDNNANNDKNDNIYIFPNFLSKEIWERFLRHRKNKKAPIDEESYQYFFDKFEKWKNEGYEPEDVINIMVDKGWRGFEPKWLEDKDDDKKRRFLEGSE